MHADLTGFLPMPSRNKFLRGVAVGIAAVDVAAAWTIVAAVSMMVILVAAQVLMRYAFNTSLSWSDEASRLAFVWSIFLGIALGVRSGAHIGINALTERIPTLPRDWLARAVALLGAALMGLVCWQSLAIAFDQWDEMMGTLHMSTGWFMLAVAFGVGHSMLHLLWIVLNGPHSAHVLTDEGGLA